MNRLEEILKKHCPSMDNLFLDKQGHEFRKRIFDAMKEYSEECCKASLEKASENATYNYDQKFDTISVNKESILNNFNITLL